MTMTTKNCSGMVPTEVHTKPVINTTMADKKGNAAVDKNECEEYRQLSDIIKLNNKGAKAVREALATIPDLVDHEAKQRLSDALLPYQEANAALTGLLNKHRQKCPECQKGN